MLTDTTELAAIEAAAPSPLPAAPLREFVATATLPGEARQERTTWATCSMEVLVTEVERLARSGVAGARIEVRPIIRTVHRRSAAGIFATALDALRQVARRARLHVRLRYLRMLLNAAEYDEHHHAHEAQRSAFRGEVAMCDMLVSQAASDRFVAQRLRVEIARVEAALWPVRGAA